MFLWLYQLQKVGSRCCWLWPIYDTHGKRWVNHSTTAPYCHMHTLYFIQVAYINLAQGMWNVVMSQGSYDLPCCKQIHEVQVAHIILALEVLKLQVLFFFLLLLDEQLILMIGLQER
jgi:hypothetical protein